MKRLKRKAEAIILYHGTTMDHTTTILMSGISADQYNYDYKGKSHNKTFFTDDVEIATEYAERKAHSRERAVVLKVNLDTNILEPDNVDCPDCETWQDSLNKIHQVSVPGSVPAYQIQSVLRYTRKGLEEYTPDEFLNNVNNRSLEIKDAVDELKIYLNGLYAVLQQIKTSEDNVEDLISQVNGLSWVIWQRTLTFKKFDIKITYAKNAIEIGTAQLDVPTLSVDNLTLDMGFASNNDIDNFTSELENYMSNT